MINIYQISYFATKYVQQDNMFTHTTYTWKLILTTPNLKPSMFMYKIKQGQLDILDLQVPNICINNTTLLLGSKYVPMSHLGTVDSA